MCQDQKFGPGCDLRRTEAERGVGPRADFECLTIFFFSAALLRYLPFTVCLIWERGRSHLSHHAHHNHLFLPFLCPSISSMGDILPHTPSGSSSPLSSMLPRVFVCHSVAGPSSLGGVNPSLAHQAPSCWASYIWTHGGGSHDRIS